MRAAFLFLLIVHGLIHLMGFMKAYDLANLKDLTLPVSKTAGNIWLLGFILFLLTGFLFILKNNSWWIMGLIAIVISQTLIFFYWKDARFGTIANVLILAVTVTACGTWSFKNNFRSEVSKYLNQTARAEDSLLSEADIERLPQAVKRYIHYTGFVGKPKIRNFQVKFSGNIRKDEQSEWMPFTSEQNNFQHNSARLFFLNAEMKHLPVAGFHCFRNGDAYMDIRLFSLFKVQYQSGKEMGIAETVTFFNDMCCMAPATLIDKRIKWLEADDNKVKAEFTNNGITITAELFFNDRGELVNFVSDNRYAVTGDNKMKQMRWSTPIKDYKEISGYRLASFAEAVYAYPEGDFCYGTFGLKDIKYNVNVMD